MRKSLLTFCALCLVGCAGTTYGISTDGTIPPIPSGANIPLWEHLCVVYDSSNATENLNKASANGFELVGLGMQGNDALMCFKRPKP
jgi:hypothetical protein